MNSIKIILSFSLFFIAFCATAQVESKGLLELEEELKTLSWDATKNRDDEQRVAAAESLVAKVQEALSLEGSFTHPFDSVQALSFLHAPDNSFRIVTWQLFVHKNQYRHFGIVQLNDGKNTLIELKDQSDDIAYPGRKELDADRWYGALYYNIKMEDSPEGKMYMLMGYDACNLYQRAKILDVMQIYEGELTFGAPIFELKKVTPPRTRREQPMITTLNKYRYIMEYSATTAASLNWNPEKEVIQFDHLILTGGLYGEGKTHVPDGSYEGFKWTGKKYEHVLKLYDQVSESAPMPSPIFDDKKKRKGRGLFGGDEKSRNKR